MTRKASPNDAKVESAPPASGKAQEDAIDRRRARALAVATDRRSARLRLWLLVRRWGGDKDIARAIALNPNAGRAVLSSVVKVSLRKGRWQVAVAAIDSPWCSRRLFEMLAISPFHAVQAAVASSPRTPQRLLRRLVGHRGAWLRLHVATNPSLLADAVDLLINDSDPYVRCVAAGHPNASAERLRDLCADYREAAWTLRAAAANPACPSDLSDQILTWLALGGAGDADPHFDPVTCSGHPGATNVNAFSWYLQEARGGGGEVHPLWRVRAAFPSSRPRILITTLIWLARDPQPEVRRVAARFNALPLSDLGALAADDDPIVARSASMAIKARKEASGTKPVRLRRRGLRALPLAAFIGVAVLVSQTASHQNTTVFPDQNGATPPSPSGFESVISGNLPLAGRAVTTRALPGGGEIESGTVDANPRFPFVTLTAGDVALTVSIPGAFSFSTSAAGVPQGAEAPDPLTLPPGKQQMLIVPDATSPMRITVQGSDGSVIDVSLDFVGS